MLYNKYRPKRFEDVVGQPAAIALKNAINAGRHPHSILITGTRGVGKTTMARILAKAVNCEAEDGRPCLVCKSCKRRNHPDIIDIDSSGYGAAGVQDLVHSMSLSPEYKNRVFIFDEAHTLTQKSMSILLRAVEEPNSTSTVILLTTEPDKIDDALRSRCMWFQLSAIPVIDIARRLAMVAKAEDMEITKEAVILLAQLSEGSMRDALSNMEIFSYLQGKKITEADVLVMSARRIDVRDLAKEIIAGNVKNALEETNKLILYYDYKVIMDNCVHEFMRELYKRLEKGLNSKHILRMVEVFRQTKRDFPSCYISQLPIECAIAQLHFEMGEIAKDMIADWDEFVVFARNKNEKLGKYVERLKPVRMKGRDILICKVNGARINQDVCKAISITAGKFIKREIGVEVV